MIVTNRKTGRLLHVSADVADALGYPVSRLLGDMAMTAWDALLPEPFCQLHKAHFAVGVVGAVASNRGNAAGGLHVRHKGAHFPLSPRFSHRSRRRPVSRMRRPLQRCPAALA